MNDRYQITTKVIASADPKMNHQTVRNLWHGFTLTHSSISIEDGQPNTFILGNCTAPHLPEGKEYALTVSKDGIAITGKDYGGLMRGYISLLMDVGYAHPTETEQLSIPAHYEESDYKLKNRMVHLCVFPETDLLFLTRAIRLCAVTQYTHVVIEFWGALQYDAMKELSWPQTFSKQKIRTLIQEIRELGMEPIPMVNQVGHASMCRLISGKHTVLDQNPKLQYLFTPDGWAWNIYSPQAKALLKKMREELYDLFGPGEYIHIGGDEADYYAVNDEYKHDFAAYLGYLTNEVVSEGRKPMVWMDMMVEANQYKDCYGSATAEEAQERRSKLAKESVLIDWQYDATEAPIESLQAMSEYSQTVIGAPWLANEAGYKAHIETLVANKMYGIMMTTWHLLNMKSIEHITGCARALNAKVLPFGTPPANINLYETASLLRRVSFEGCTYETAGWQKNQI